MSFGDGHASMMKFMCSFTLSCWLSNTDMLVYPNFPCRGPVIYMSKEGDNLFVCVTNVSARLSGITKCKVGEMTGMAQRKIYVDFVC